MLTGIMCALRYPTDYSDNPSLKFVKNTCDRDFNPYFIKNSKPQTQQKKKELNQLEKEITQLKQEVEQFWDQRMKQVK